MNWDDNVNWSLWRASEADISSYKTFVCLYDKGLMLKTSSYTTNLHFINQLQNCLIIFPGSKCVYLIGNHLLTVIKLFFFSSQVCACVSPWSLIQQQTSPSWLQVMKVVSLCSGMLWLEKSWVEIQLTLNQVNHRSLVVLHIYEQLLWSFKFVPPNPWKYEPFAP